MHGTSGLVIDFRHAFFLSLLLSFCTRSASPYHNVIWPTNLLLPQSFVRHLTIYLGVSGRLCTRGDHHGTALRLRPQVPPHLHRRVAREKELLSSVLHAGTRNRTKWKRNWSVVVFLLSFHYLWHVFSLCYTQLVVPPSNAATNANPAAGGEATLPPQGWSSFTHTHTYIPTTWTYKDNPHHETVLLWTITQGSHSPPSLHIDSQRTAEFSWVQYSSTLSFCLYTVCSITWITFDGYSFLKQWNNDLCLLLPVSAPSDGVYCLFLRGVGLTNDEQQTNVQ